MTDKRHTYKKVLKESAEVRAWHSNMSQGSEITADVNLRRLVAFCNETGMGHKELIQMKPKALQMMLIDFVAMKSKEKKPDGSCYAGSYIHSTVKAVKSWLAFNDIDVNKVKVKGAYSRPTLKGEQVPTQGDLRKILLAATMRDRVSCVLVAHSGLRLESLGDYKGEDGLTIGDFPDMEIRGDKIEFTKIPVRVMVRGEISKAGHQYFSFLSEEGCEYLKAYLEYRIGRGETLTPESDIIHAKIWSKRFITTINVGDGMREAIRKAGFRVRPYVLRSYFDTNLLMAESKGKIPNQYRKFFMGHVGDMEARYTTNKENLPDDLIEDMREAYARAQPFIQSRGSGPTESEADRDIRYTERFLKMFGFGQDEIDKMDLAGATDEQIGEMVKSKQMAAMKNNGNSQKVIPKKEIKKYIEGGWEFAADLGDGNVIIKLPQK